MISEFHSKGEIIHRSGRWYVRPFSQPLPGCVNELGPYATKAVALGVLGTFPEAKNTVLTRACTGKV